MEPQGTLAHLTNKSDVCTYGAKRVVDCGLTQGQRSRDGGLQVSTTCGGFGRGKQSVSGPRQRRDELRHFNGLIKVPMAAVHAKNSCDVRNLFPISSPPTPWYRALGRAAACAACRPSAAGERRCSRRAASTGRLLDPATGNQEHLRTAGNTCRVSQHAPGQPNMTHGNPQDGLAPR